MYSSINAIITPSSSSSSSSSSTTRRRRSCFSSRGIQELKSKAFGVGAANTNISCLLSWSRSKSNWLLFKVPKTNTKTKTNVFVSVSPPPLSTSISMEMQTCSVKMEVDVPTSVAYQCYSDREAMPKWMPFISSVKILEDKPDQSRWTLKYKAFGRDIEFSWLARNLQPIPNQKIHWRSLEGLPNSGAVRFYPRGPSSCLIELSVSYEVPQLLAPVASALQPFLESLLLRGLERFSKFAKSRQPESAN